MLKRTRERASLFGALFGVVAIVSGLAVGLVGYLAAAETTGVRTELASRTGGDSGLVMTLDRDDDISGQDAWVRGLIAQQFVDGDRAIPLEVFRTVLSAKAVPLRVGGAVAPSGEDAIVESIPELADRASIVEGVWPSSAGEVSVQADAAAQLGISAGDTLTLGDATVLVTATWRLTDPLDRRWLGDALITSGIDGVDAGPIVIDESEWDAVGAAVLARWTITPVIDQIVASDVRPMLEAWRGMSRAARLDTAFDSTSLDESGRLSRTLTTLQQRSSALHAVEPVPLMIIAAIGLVTLVELARLLVGLRSAERLLLWSRGASVSSITRSTAVEAAVVSLAGAAVGAGAAVAVLYATLGSEAALAAIGPALWLLPAGVAVASTAIFTGSTVAAARSLGRGVRSDDAGRLAKVGAPAVAILVSAAAALSVWQLLLYGSPIAPSSGGGTQVDPVAVAAPVLTLVAVVLVSLVALPLLAPLVERAASRSTGLDGPLVSRTLVRRLRLAAAPIVVCALACGQLVLAAGYGASWSESFQVTSELRAGTEVRLSGANLAGATADSALEAAGVVGIAAVSIGSTGVGTDEVSLIGVTPQALAAVATDGGGTFDRSTTATALGEQDESLLLPPDAHRVSLSASVTGFAELPAASVVLVDPLGLQRTLPLTTVGATGYAADLPAAPNPDSGGWKIAALEADLSQPFLDAATGDESPTFAISTVEVDGSQIALAGSWTTAVPGDADFKPSDVTDSPSFVSPGLVGPVRMLPAFARGSDTLALSVVISQTLADRAGLALGDRLNIDLDPRYDITAATITGIVAAVPGASSDGAVLVDLGALQAVHLRKYVTPADPNQLWVQTTDPQETTADLRSSLPASVRVESLSADPSRGILGSASFALWIGAVGSGLLAIVAVAAVTGAQLRSRRGEVVVLRALGMSGRGLAGMRRRELATSLALGLVVGSMAGVIVTYLTVPALARAAVPDPYPSLPTVVGFDLAALGIGFGVFSCLLLAVGVVYAAQIHRQVRRLSTGEEAGESAR